jgi:YXWGXW repeat-containing protein
MRHIILIAACAAIFSGCVVVPARHHYVGGVVLVAPPPPPVEVYGVAPGPGHIWISGYWNWVGGRHEWVGGHWEAPHRGYRYTPHRWVHERDGWHLQEGYWTRH